MGWGTLRLFVSLLSVDFLLGPLVSLLSMPRLHCLGGVGGTGLLISAPHTLSFQPPWGAWRTEPAPRPSQLLELAIESTSPLLSWADPQPPALLALPCCGFVF